jgi:hypothetical protein
VCDVVAAQQDRAAVRQRAAGAAHRHIAVAAAPRSVAPSQQTAPLPTGSRAPGNRRRWAPSLICRPTPGVRNNGGRWGEAGIQRATRQTNPSWFEYPTTTIGGSQSLCRFYSNFTHPPGRLMTPSAALNGITVRHDAGSGWCHGRGTHGNAWVRVVANTGTVRRGASAD